jgi:hypothetical protein
MVIDQRLHHRAERDTDDHTDRKIDDVAPQNERSKILQHGSLLPKCRSRVRVGERLERPATMYEKWRCGVHGELSCAA